MKCLEAGKQHPGPSGLGLICASRRAGQGLPAKAGSVAAGQEPGLFLSFRQREAALQAVQSACLETVVTELSAGRT